MKLVIELAKIGILLFREFAENYENSGSILAAVEGNCPFLEKGTSQVNVIAF